MTNKTFVLFLVVFFIFNLIGTYFLLYDENIIRTLVVNSVSYILVTAIFIAKRNWDREQEKDFK